MFFSFKTSYLFIIFSSINSNFVKFLQCVVVSLARRRSKKDNPSSYTIEYPPDYLIDFNEQSETRTSNHAVEFKCERVGRFAYPGSCEKYIFCWDKNEGFRVFTCPHHKAFDPNTQLCVHNFAVCAAAPKCEYDLQFLPHLNYKSSFFQCSLISSDQSESDIRFRLYKKICAHGGEFDAILGYCKLTTENENNSGEDENAKKVDCKETGIFIDFSDDTRYYECIEKSVTFARIHQTCPYNHVFSMADKRCVKLNTDEK